MGTDERKDFHVNGLSWLVLYFWRIVSGSWCALLPRAHEPRTSLKSYF